MRGKLKVGIDFGTTNTTVAFFDAQDVLHYYYYDKRKSAYIPSKLFYREKNRRYIGHSAVSQRLKKGPETFYEHFKMFLPLTEDQLQRCTPWNQQGRRVPRQVVRDFLQTLIEKLVRDHGEVDVVVCSVPELWQHEALNYGTRQLRDIVTVKLDLNLGLLCSEPVCAAAYYAYVQDQAGAPFHGNVLVCDMGGGTFDVALCRVEAEKIEVLTFEGYGQARLAAAGVAFDHNVVEIVYATEGQAFETEEERWLLLRRFEEEKLNEATQDEMAEVLAESRKQAMDPDLLNQVIVYDFEGHKVSLGQMRQALAPIREGISETMKKIVAWTSDHGESIDELLIVGGFGQHPFVEQAIVEMLDGKDKIDPAFQSEHYVLHAVAAGAAVIASDKIVVVEHFPHTIGFDSHETVGGLRKKVPTPILKAGKHPVGGGIVWASDAHGKPLCVQVLEQDIRVPLWLLRNGKGRHIALDQLGTVTPKPGDYELGVHVDQNYLAQLCFKRVRTAKGTKVAQPEIEYVCLGTLPIEEPS